MSLVIRAFRQADRQAVRALACETAARGEAVERFFHDREVFADLLTRYYMEWEPHALWIAEQDGAVVEGVTCGLDASGFLVIREDSGREITILAGGVRSVG